MEFSSLTIHDGRAMPNVAACGPSGLPYFSQFSRATSSVNLCQQTVHLYTYSYTCNIQCIQYLCTHYYNVLYACMHGAAGVQPVLYIITCALVYIYRSTHVQAIILYSNIGYRFAKYMYMYMYTIYMYMYMYNVLCR